MSGAIFTLFLCLALYFLYGWAAVLWFILGTAMVGLLAIIVVVVIANREAKRPGDPWV